MRCRTRSHHRRSRRRHFKHYYDESLQELIEIQFKKLSHFQMNE